MRETRQSGSEGGARLKPLSLPLSGHDANAGAVGPGFPTAGSGAGWRYDVLIIMQPVCTGSKKTLVTQ